MGLMQLRNQHGHHLIEPCSQVLRHTSYPILRDVASDFEGSHKHLIERKLADGSAVTKPAI